MVIRLLYNIQYLEKKHMYLDLQRGANETLRDGEFIPFRYGTIWHPFEGAGIYIYTLTF